jgi:hypothetical protein
MNFTKKILCSFLLVVGLISNQIQAKSTIPTRQAAQVESVHDDRGRTPLMDVIIELDVKIKEIKYGNDEHALARAMVGDSYFLNGTYSYVGPLVSDMIQAKVEHLAQKIKDELARASVKIDSIIRSAEDFNIKDFDGKTVMQHCTTKEVYELLRKHGAAFQVNRAVRIYGRYYAPAMLDYMIAMPIVFLSLAGYVESNQYKINKAL